MNQKELNAAADVVSEELAEHAQTFTNSLMGKGFKPLVNALIRYIKLTNRRFKLLEHYQQKSEFLKQLEVENGRS